MKKAPKMPKRKGYAEGGETTYDDPKKPLDLKMTPEEWDALNKKHGNIPYGTSVKASGHKYYYDPKLYNITKDEFGRESTLDAEGNSTMPEIYGYEYKAPVKTKPTSTPKVYGNVDPETGKQIPYQAQEIKRAKGGTVYKMKKCPMKKGGKIC